MSSFGLNQSARAFFRKLIGLDTTVYYIDPDQSDQGALTGSAIPLTIADVLASVGTSKKVLIKFAHTSSANETEYSIDTDIDCTSYPKAFFSFSNGAILTQVGGTETITFYSPENIIASRTQPITKVDSIKFAFGGTVFPERWNAKGDGVTDDADSIQYSIDSLPSPYGGRVKFRSLFYIVSKPIVVSKGHIKLEGESIEWFASGGSRLKSTDSNSSVLVIDGGSAGTPLQMNFVKNLGIGKDIETDSSGGSGIELRHVVRPRITDCTIENCLAGISCYNVTNATIERNVISRPISMPVGSTSFGIYIDGSVGNPSIRIKNNTIAFPVPPHDGSAIGIYNIGSTITDLFIENNDISWCDYGIYVSYSGSTILYSQDLHISDNIIDSYISEGIHVDGIHTPGAVKIHGNWTAPVPTGVSDYGIRCVDMSGPSITSNQHFGFTNFAYDIGVYLDSVVGGVIANNIIKGSSTQIGLNDCNSVSLTSNNLRSDSGYISSSLIALTGSSNNNTITANTFDGYSSVGVVLGASTSNNIFALNTIITSNITTKVANSGSSNLIQHNKGFVTENHGVSPGITTGSTFPHGLDGTPTIVNVSCTAGAVSGINWTADSANITLNWTGGGTISFNWEAKIR